MTYNQCDHRVRECHVLMLFNRTKGGFIAAPYLDDYGETDQGLRLVTPQYTIVVYNIAYI